MNLTGQPDPKAPNAIRHTPCRTVLELPTAILDGVLLGDIEHIFCHGCDSHQPRTSFVWCATGHRVGG